MTCRVQADLAGAIPVAAVVDRLEFIELSFMGNDGRDGMSSRSVTIKLRYRDREAAGQHYAPTRMLDCVCHAMMKAARGLGVFTNGDEPKMTIFEVKSCGPGSDTEGDFVAALEYRGHSRSIRLRDKDLVTGSRRAFLDSLNALLFGGEPASTTQVSSPPGENKDFIGSGCE